MFDLLWENYPKQIGMDDAEKAWAEVAVDVDTAWKIIDALDSWCKSEQWLEKGGRFIPRAAKFLREGYWKTAPVAEAPKGRKLDDDEIAAVRRMLEEDEE